MLETYLAYLVFGILRGCSYSLMGIGLSMIYGILGIVNFAHGEFFMLGAYISFYAITLLGLDPTISAFVTFAVVLAVGMVLAKILLLPAKLRAREEWFESALLITLGLSNILQNVALIICGARYMGVTNFYPGRISFLGIMFFIDRLVVFVVGIFMMVLFWQFMQRTKIGKAMRAVAQDEDAASVVGIDVDRIHLLSFGIGSALAGFSGALLLFTLPAYPSVGVVPVTIAFAVVILGGMGSIKGAIIGGFVLGITESFVGGLISANLQVVAFFLIIVVVLMIRPTGLFGEKKRI